MINRSKQRGEGNLGCIIWVVIAALVCLFLWKWVPIKVANTQLREYMIEQAKFAQRPKVEVFRKRIVDKAKELGLPVTLKNVNVSIGSGKIRMRCKYTVPLEFLSFTYEWKVDHQVVRPIFFA